MANPLLPQRLFLEGVEPNSERVQSYSELPLIDLIPNSLDAEDIEFLRNSQFVNYLKFRRDQDILGSSYISRCLENLWLRKKMNSGWYLLAPLSASEFQSFKE